MPRTMGRALMYILLRVRPSVCLAHKFYIILVDQQMLRVKTEQHKTINKHKLTEQAELGLYEAQYNTLTL